MKKEEVDGVINFWKWVDKESVEKNPFKQNPERDSKVSYR